MKERVRIAIVGCGAIAHWHLDAVDFGRCGLLRDCSRLPPLPPALRVRSSQWATPTRVKLAVRVSPQRPPSRRLGSPTERRALPR